MTGDVWLASKGIVALGGERKDSDIILGLLFNFYYFKSSKSLKIYYVDEDKNPKHYYHLPDSKELGTISEEIIRDPKLFDTTVKEIELTVLKTPEAQEKIKKFLSREIKDFNEKHIKTAQQNSDYFLKEVCTPYDNDKMNILLTDMI